MRSRNDRHHPPRQQRGAFSIIAGVTLLVALACLMLVVDSGRLYLEQRRLQKLADTAALEAVTRLESGDCSHAPDDALEFAAENATRQGFLDNARQSLTAECVTIISQNDRRTASVASDGRAVRVILGHRVPASLVLRSGNLFDASIPADVELRAVAVAEREEPGAAFSVGAQLLRLNDNKLLGTLLKTVGLDPQLLTVLDSAGLANVSVTPAGLLQALGVNVGIEPLKALSPAGLVELADTEVGLLSLDKLLVLSLDLITDNALETELKALQEAVSVNSLLRDVQLHLFRTDEHPGLLALSTDAVGSALDARVNLEQLLSTALMIGLHEEGRGLKLDEVGVAGLVTVKAGVVEPPSIGIGPIGTTAFNAQVRLLVDVDTDDGLLSPLLKLLGTRINLPVIVDLVDATGTLTAIDCSASPPEATIEVESRVGSTCIGRMPEDALWSTRGSCTSAVQDETMIRLLGSSLLHGQVALPVLRETDELTLAEGESGSTGVNSLNLGTLVDELVDELLKLLATSGSVPDSFTPAQATSIADRYLALPLLAPSASSGNYSLSDLHKVQDRLEADGLDWDRPGLLGLLARPMHEEWRSKAETNCLSLTHYRSDCVRNTLIASLQTEADGGLLGGLLTTLFGKVVQPLLANVLDPLTDALKGILDLVGDLLTSLLADTLGLELGRTDVEVQAISCGIPRLVR